MHENHSVETILARLMPPAISEAGQRDIEAMLDDLAGPTQIAEQPSSPPANRRMIVGGLAAALAAAVVISRLMEPVIPTAVTATDSPDLMLVSESDRIESMVDEGWREIPDGSAMRAMRVRVIEENNLYDAETGIVMQVTEPREELLLMPISAF